MSFGHVLHVLLDSHFWAGSRVKQAGRGPAWMDLLVLRAMCVDVLSLYGGVMATG